MTITLNHTIVHALDVDATAGFWSTVLGLAEPKRLGPFTVLQIGPTSIDLLPAEQPVSSRHFAFLVDEAAFDEIFTRILARGIDHWADPGRRQAGEINHWDDGRGVYFPDPNDHLLEIITRPYGSGGTDARHPNPLLGVSD